MNVIHIKLRIKAFLHVFRRWQIKGFEYQSRKFMYKKCVQKMFTLLYMYSDGGGRKKGKFGGRGLDLQITRERVNGSSRKCSKQARRRTEQVTPCLPSVSQWFQTLMNCEAESVVRSMFSSQNWRKKFRSNILKYCHTHEKFRCS